ncbi:MAG: response regulator transcription factor [Myxococcota bacterium]|nr:response regulator transcription factor [Myxococcota bacterium]
MTPAEIALELQRLLAAGRTFPKRPLSSAADADADADADAVPPIRVVIADDHQIVLDGLRVLLEGEADIEVVGKAEDGAAAIRIAAELTPDVVVMDIRMPGLDGVEATREIRRRSPDTRVIALSAESDPQTVDRMLRAGASGYLTKQRAYGELVQAIRAVMNGTLYLTPEVARLIASGTLAAPCARPRRRI